MRLRRRLGLVAAAYVALMLAAGLAALAASKSRANSAAKGRSLTVALEQVGQMRSAFLDMETGVRGFEITADDTFLEPCPRQPIDGEIERRDRRGDK
jgi:CHASE3 domain sensor protein